MTAEERLESTQPGHQPVGSTFLSAGNFFEATALAREAIALLRDERKYLSHTNKCALTNMQPAEMVYPDCTCGFYKLMARHKEFLDGEGGDE